MDITKARFFTAYDGNVVMVIPGESQSLVACPEGHVHEGPGFDVEKVPSYVKEISKEQARSMRPALAAYLDSIH